MEPEKITDYLLAGISDDLTNRIDLFIINSNLGNDNKQILVDFFNEVYLEGSFNSLPRHFKMADDAMKEESKTFNDNFTNMLLNGNNKPVS